MKHAVITAFTCISFMILSGFMAYTYNKEEKPDEKTVEIEKSERCSFRKLDEHTVYVCKSLDKQ